MFSKGCSRGNKLPCMLSVFSCSISVSPWVCLSNSDWKSKGHVQLKLLRASCIWYILSKSLLVKHFRVGPHQVILLCLPSEIPYLLCMVRVQIRYLCFINVLHYKTYQSAVGIIKVLGSILGCKQMKEELLYSNHCFLPFYCLLQRKCWIRSVCQQLATDYLEA